jgi:type III pantothenate kinase
MSPLKEIQKIHDSLPKVDCFTCDIGNSNPHIGIWKKGHIQEVIAIDPSKIKETLEELPVDKTIVCSVSKEIPSSESIRQFLTSNNEGPKTFLNMPVHYENTLGHDRLILASYLYQALNKNPSIIIDAGTFITIDFIGECGLQGGLIIPGLKTLEKSYQVGSQLFSPSNLKNLFLTKEEKEYSWPQTTKDAINEGHKFLIEGLLDRVSSQVQKIKSTYPNLQVILTGGSGELFQHQLQSQNFHPHLLHYSLYFQQVSTLS